MKLLVLAQTPPPLHGQSVMVQAMVQGLPGRGVPLHHIDFQLSPDAADIGRWRIGKIFATVGFALRTVRARFRHGCDALYYVPAPPEKRGALYRDWLVMALCRPFFPRLVLHWHAAGLAEWLEAKGTRVERALTRTLLGGADLSIVLADSLRHDAEWLGARRVAVVPNGIADPGVVSPPPSSGPVRLLFLALCSEEKGLFSAADAVRAANREVGAPAKSPAFVLTAAGPFADEATAERFHELAAENPCIEYAGIVTGEEKRRLFAAAHALCLPTRYAAEGQPLVAIEALAHDRPVIATRWRALPDIVTEDVGVTLATGDATALVRALLGLRNHKPAPGACRSRFLAEYTLERHLSKLAATLDAPPPARPAAA